MKQFSILSMFLVVLISTISAQVGVGEWRDHLPYQHGKKVAISDAKIYCATSDALFSWDTFDFSIEKLTKVNGLSDIGISAISYNEEYNTLMVTYTNANIDLVKGNEIVNISDIKRKQIIGNKRINHICFIDQFAYLSCGFGIVVVNIEREEITDTYYIGDSGSKINVNKISYDAPYLYAATDQGIYKADINTTNLANYEYWTKMTNIPHYNGEFPFIAHYDNNLYFVTRGETVNTDTLFQFDGVNYEVADETNHFFYSLDPSHGKLVACFWGLVVAYETGLSNSLIGWEYCQPRNAFFDDNGDLWAADDLAGLVRWRSGAGHMIVHPNGPYKSSVVDLAVGGGNLLSAGGARGTTWNNLWTQGEVDFFKDETWSTYIASGVDTAYDIVSVIVDPEDPRHSFAGSWNGGLIEFYDNSLKKVWRSNSSLQSVIPGVYYKVGGMAFDADGDLWVTNPDVSSPISVMTKSGVWHSFAYGSLFDKFLIDEIIVTQNDHKWISLPTGAGLFAFDDKGTYSVLSDDQTKAFSILDQYGNLITNDISSIAEDKDGYIWIGTNAGVVVYYNAENVFTGENFFAQRVIVEINGSAQYLLETETVTDIVIDGANRKWFGTQNAGVFLMSEDGTEQILNFNTDNSPLLSNTIYCIAIDGDSGEVFFGTDKGIISYKGDATEPKDGFKDIYVYPNPVRETYEGTVTVTNLVANSNIKITDISGNIVYETQAEGGQASWDGKNFAGVRVKTGVYLVFCTNEDGSKTKVTKLLFIN